MHYFNDLISDEEHFIDVPDCIADGSSYKETFENSFNITQGILKLDEFSWTKNNEKFEFELVVNGKAAGFSVCIASDYVDSSGLIEGLNNLLNECGYSGDKRFCDINGGVADFGIAFITKEKESDLVTQGLIWRSEEWKINQELFKIYNSFKLKTNQSEKSLVGKWVGYFKYLEKEEITLFKLIIIKEENGEIEGIIHEGNDFHQEKNDYITFKGKRDNSDLSFIKNYGDGLFKKLAQVMRLKEIENDLPKTKIEIVYLGRIVNSNFAFGKWTKGKSEIILNGIDFGENESNGRWEMKLVE